MDASLLTSCALVGILAAGLGCWFVKKRLPAMVMPFALLPEETRERIARRKLCWRGAALAVFALAAATMFSGLPRGVTVLCVCVGFFCQYRVLCLRRRYPMSSAPICFSERSLGLAGSSGGNQQTEDYDERMEKTVSAHGDLRVAGVFRGRGPCRGPGENENRLDGRA